MTPRKNITSVDQHIFLKCILKSVFTSHCTDTGQHKFGEVCRYLSVAESPAPAVRYSWLRCCYVRRSVWTLRQAVGPLQYERAWVEIQRQFSKPHNSTIIQKIKIPRSLSQASASNHSNAVTFTLPLPEGQMSGAWEPSNKIMLFLPPR
jgi:hypothetical protein